HFLVNKSLTKRLCLNSTLLKYLFQAAAAIEYCHMKDIILRDITAKSFIVAANNSVKLFKFKLARKLGAQSEIVE
ncbi:Abelson tyrosine-protein kinase 2, partial [Biomphalaria glabrata]